MKKIVLIDGNNLIFRSYYATAYSGNLMKNSKGFPTNGLFGFYKMINNIIKDEKPDMMVVAFDIGKNFRKSKYDFYKEGRSATPEELKMQMPLAKDMLDKMGITYLELEPYEADDIIGTLAKVVDDSSEYEGVVVSSDKDLLQLISDKVVVKHLKSKDYIRYTPEVFISEYGINPINIIDMKAIAGDSSDNIPGVKGIGDKGALKLLVDYKDLDGIYENIDSIKGKTQEKLINDKDMAYVSKEIATIYKEVPIDNDLTKYEYSYVHSNELNELLKDLEFYSLIKDVDSSNSNIIEEDVKFIDVKSINDIEVVDEYSFYIECDSDNYHYANILGMSLSTKSNNYYINKDLIRDVFELIKDKVLYTYDHKKNYVLLDKLGINVDVNFDMMLALYLLNYNVKDDIANVMNSNGIDILFYDKLIKEEDISKYLVLKSKFIFDNRDKYMIEIKSNEMEELFFNVEMPLIKVLAKMEIQGVCVNLDVLSDMNGRIKEEISSIESKIYELVGEEFNVGSPKQLGVILFEKLELPYGKVSTSGAYKTDVKVLEKLRGKHPVIELILEYRNLSKLSSTYLEGLSNYVVDGKIHTIYKQAVTRTGRLSSVEPNLQNIPTRMELGRLVRKAFVPSNNIFFSADYSQIELRILAHISGDETMIKAFNDGNDIHSIVASDIYDVPVDMVSKEMRKSAKAVIFGIVYGISSFGLGEDLNISMSDAKKFIEKYYLEYPKVKEYMDNIVKEAYDTISVRTIFNRKRDIEELNNNNYMIRQMGERIALNTPIQGSAADIIKMAMIEIDKAFVDMNINSKMILQVHDELVFDCIDSEKDLVNDVVTKVMEGVVELSVPLVVSHDFGTDWYDTK